VTTPNVRDDIGLLLAITSQLFQSRVAEILGEHGLSYSQFSVLSYLEGVGQPTAISAIASAMEINQPGVTKVVKRLAEMGLVDVTADESDSRKRLAGLAVNAPGRLADVRKDLDRDSAQWFEDWKDPELIQFRDHLSTLAHWLDQNRLS